MSRHGYGYHSGGSGIEGLAGMLLVVCIVVAAIGLFLFVRSCVFIGKTLYSYYKHSQALKVSVVVCIAFVLLSSLLSLALNNAAYEAGASVGYAQLLVVSAVVHRQNADTFMAASTVSIQDAILHRKWWEDSESSSMAA
jgi:hypothetical protein